MSKYDITAIALIVLALVTVLIGVQVKNVYLQVATIVLVFILFAGGIYIGGKRE